MASPQNSQENQELNRFEQFIVSYRQYLTIGLSVVLIAIAGYLIWNQFILQPQQKEAQQEIFQAQQYFSKDSLDKALHGDNQYKGFLEIAEDYSWTKSGNLANYYIGVIYLKKGDYQKSIDHLKSFNTESKMVGSMALGCMGDAYSELQQYDEAITYYIDAANKNPNKYTSPVFLKKAGIALEEQKRFDRALEVYQKLKNEYGDSDQANNVEKYIARVRAKINTNKS